MEQSLPPGGFPGHISLSFQEGRNSLTRRLGVPIIMSSLPFLTKQMPSKILPRRFFLFFPAILVGPHPTEGVPRLSGIP